MHLHISHCKNYLAMLSVLIPYLVFLTNFKFKMKIIYNDIIILMI